jgi:dihydrofolate reductase
MGKIVISENVSLDGVVEDPTGVEGLDRGGWFFETDRGVDGEKFTLEKTLATEALLLGRRSYEFFAATWPSRGGELADKMNSLPKYVVSSTLQDPSWSNSTVLNGDVVDDVSKLKQQRGGEIVVLGSPQLARTLIECDLVDEVRLMIYPVVLGAGARLFGETSDKKPVRLIDSQTVGDGVAILTYAMLRDAERATDGASLQDKRAAALRQAGIREEGAKPSG